jgi:hypothetical protein
VKAINLCDGGKRCRAVGKEMGDGHTHIMNILKRKREILDDFENNAPSSRKFQHDYLTKYAIFIVNKKL